MKRNLFFIIYLLASYTLFSQDYSHKAFIPETGLTLESLNNDIIFTQDDEIILPATSWTTYNDNEPTLMKIDTGGNVDWCYQYKIGSSNDNLSSALQTSNHEIMLAGHTASTGEGFFDMFYMLLDSSGNVQWSKTIGTNDYDYGQKIIEDTDGNFIIAGTVNLDICLIKLTPSGDTLWSRIYDGGAQDYLYSVCETQNGYAFYGRTRSESYGDYDLMLVLTDKNGNLKNPETQSTWVYGGEDVEYAIDIKQTDDNGLIMLGVSKSYGVTSGMDHDILLIKTDSLGNIEWSRQIGESNYTYSFPNVQDDYAYSLTIDEKGNYFISGKTKHLGNGNWDLVCMKVDTAGNYLWGKTYGSEDEEMSGISSIHNNDIYIFGKTGGFDLDDDGIYLVKADSNGNTYSYYENNAFMTVRDSLVQNKNIVIKPVGYKLIVNTNTPSVISKTINKETLNKHFDIITFKDYIYDDYSIFSNGVVIKEDGYIFSGTINPGNKYEYVLYNTDMEGDVNWKKSFGTSATDNMNHIIETSKGYLMIGKTKYNNNPTSYTDGFLVQTDFSGDLLWSKAIGDTTKIDEFIHGSLTSTNDIIVVGKSKSMTTGDYDIMAAKLTSNGDTAWVKSYGTGRNDEAVSIHETKENNYLVLGYTKLGTFPNSEDDLFFLLLNPDGDTIWTKHYNYKIGETISSSCMTNDGGFVVVGKTTTTYGYFFIAKFDINGNQEWIKNIHPSTSSAATAYDVKQTKDGGYIISGRGDKIFLCKTENKGNVLWLKSYLDLPDFGMIAYSGKLQETNDKGYIATFNARDDDMIYRSYIIKTDENGYSGKCFDNETMFNAHDLVFKDTAFNVSVKQTGTRFVDYTSEITANVPVFQKEFLDIAISGNITDVKCYGQKNGAIDITIQNGITPYQFSWSDSSSNQDRTNIKSGAYTITVSDKFGCEVSGTFEITQPELLTSSVTKKDVSCYLGLDGMAIATTGGGTPPYYYYWNNGMISDTASNLYAGTYFVNVIDNNGCAAATQNVVIHQPRALSILFAKEHTTCGKHIGSMQAMASGGTRPYTFNWSNAGTDSIINDLSAGTYSVTVTDSNHCEAIAQEEIEIHAQPQPICIVTVDEESGKNQIVWSKTTNQAIRHYNVYKQSYTGNFDFLAQIPYDSVSYCLDGTSNPETRAERYKITVVDSCGNESELSDHHKTLHLNVSKSSQGDGFALTWSHYEGFDFNTYQILRGTSATNLTVIDSMAYYINSFTYTDTEVSEDSTYYYRLAAINPDGSCLATKASGGPFSRSVSNLEDNRLKSDNIEENTTNPVQLSVFPNPSNGKVKIQYTLQKTEDISIDLYSVLGNKIDNIVNEKQERGVYIQDYELPSSGAYFVKCHVNGVVITKKIICLD